MRVAIAGAHGKIATHLSRVLIARGDTVVGLIRNPDHADDVRATGAEPVVCDLEHASVEAVATAVAGSDAVVFAAGAGPGSGAERKLTMDRDGAIKLLGATATDSTPYVIVSSIGADNPPDDDEVFSVYLRAKAAADAAVMASARDWTVLRPGYLTDEPATGRVRLESTPFRERVTRADVAAVLAVILHEPRASHRVLYLGGGSDPLEQAVQQAVATPS